MKRIICDAIESRSELRFSYHGGTRKAEPHCYGVGKDGDELLRAYQTSGFSSSGNHRGWKLLQVSEMKSITLSGAVFERPRRGYNRDDPAMDRFVCRL